MKQFKVIIDVYHSKNHVETKALTVEAGNKRLAGLRALGEISKQKEFIDLYKSIRSIELVV